MDGVRGGGIEREGERGWEREGGSKRARERDTERERETSPRFFVYILVGSEMANFSLKGRGLTVCCTNLFLVFRERERGDGGESVSLSLPPSLSVSPLYCSRS